VETVEEAASLAGRGRGPEGQAGGGVNCGEHIRG